MRTLVTGASGFVGKHLLQHLPDAFALTRDRADLRKPLPPLPPADVVFHCAGVIDEVNDMQAVNVEGTRRLIDWAVASRVKTFVLLSTGGVTGEGPYAESKRAAEDIARAAGALIDVQIVRLFFPYGPGQSAKRLVPRLIANVRAGVPIRVTGDGPMLSLTFIDDVIDGLLRISGVAGSHVVDLGGPALSMREIGTAIGAVLGVAPRFESGTGGTHWIADSDALRALTGHAPETPLLDGLRRSV
ncbi:MAG TPA: NAD(P)-dependent oxidoreductase [Thermoanaerobaculia bacterium]|nr:NAD(P)-dependent oxidoreductase [Thermoanaerobaculia bacterium]